MSSLLSNWPIVVLSLGGDDGRRKPLLESLGRLGLDFDVFLGVDGRNGLSQEWESEIDRVAARQAVGRDMSDGEFACALSHREIYRKIRLEGWSGAIVLEDDAILSPQFSVFLAHQIYYKADLILLDHSHARVAREVISAFSGIELRRLAISPSLATAYSISASAAEFLIAANTPIRGIADWPCDVTRIGAAAMVPQIVGHPDQKAGVSHLRRARQDLIMSHKQKTAFKVRQLMSLAFWRRWISKRLSRRVS